MKRVQRILYTFLAVILYACHSDFAIDSPIQPSFTCNIQSRGNENINYLPIGSQILLNANGGIELDNEIFTYNGSTWENENLHNWSFPEEETNITAIYPTYKDNSYTELNLYSKGQLEDILIARNTSSGKESIHLQFEHLFSSLIIHIENTILENLKEIQLAMPVKVEKISPKEGTFSIINETHTVIKKHNSSNDFSFIIPPTEECSLTLTIIMTDDTIHEILLNPHTFQCGIQYECNVLQFDTRPGIRNAKDLIIFSQLINGGTNAEKTLADFGELVGEEMVYRLLADIELTEYECNQLAPIGDHSDNPFSDTFDGGGHTISNFILPDQNTNKGYSGLFGHISQTGVVKNLHLTKAKSIQTPTCKYLGVIASNNDGIIDNCSVSNSTIHSIEGGYPGIICALSAGTIINCYTTNNLVYVSSSAYAGGITSSAGGNILNCFSYQNKFSTSGKSYRIGSITGASITRITLKIENCYIYHTQSTSYWGSAIGLANKVSIKNFYYNKGNIYYGTATSTTTSNNLKYDADYFINTEHISTLLNNWIETTGNSQYSQFTFRNWKISENGSACYK